MRPFNLLQWLATAACLTSYVGAKPEDFPVGISLRHTELLPLTQAVASRSSAYYDSDRRLHFVTTIESSKEWQDHFWKTYQDEKNQEPYYDPETVSMFSRTLQEIKKATEDKLHRSVEIGAIDVPEHFYFRSSGQNIFMAAEKEGLLSNPRQWIQHFNAARLAYKLDNCEAYNFPQDCDMDDLSSDDQQHLAYVMIVEYDKEYFSLGIMACGSIWCTRDATMRSAIYGEHAIGTALNDLENERTNSLIATIQQFVTEKLEEVGRAAAIPDLGQHIRAVILSGQASTSSMNDMKHVLASAIPSFADRLRFTLDPRLVGAAGAARWAEHTITHHYFTNPWPEPHLQYAPGAHDEL